MISLYGLLKEVVLLREISNSTELYHRSLRKMKVGDVIEPPKGREIGKDYIGNSACELAMEEKRKEIASDVPSRLNCVYSSLIPRSRFVDKGYLYRVRSTGRIFVSDSKLIDSIAEKFNEEYNNYIGRYDGLERKDIEDALKRYPIGLTRYLPYEATEYWNGKISSIDGVGKFGKGVLRDIEVLSDGAEVMEVINESEKATPFVMGDDVVVAESRKLKGYLTVYLNGELDNKSETEKKNLSSEEMKDFINYISDNIFDGVKPEVSKYSKETYEFLGYLKKGVKLKIISLASNIRGGRRGGNIAAGKYETIMIDFYYNGKLINRSNQKNDRNIAQSFIISRWNNEDIADYSKYLKKV